MVPILHDAGELRTRFGTYLLGAGAVGEFGPILLITLVLAGSHPIEEAALLVAFVALSVITALAAMRSKWRGWTLLVRPVLARRLVRGLLAVVMVLRVDT